jgi:AraC-like DNA-binding protein
MQLFQRRLAVQILKSKYFIWVIIPSFILGAFILVYFSSIKEYAIFPNKHKFQILLYTDQSIGGNSQIINKVMNDSVIKINFELKDSISSPYIGISISPKVDSIINLAHYNQINLKIKGIHIDNIGIGLFTKNTDAYIARQNPVINFYTTFKISSEISQYRIPAEKFAIPDWWSELNNMSNTQNMKPDLKRVLGINICNAYTPNIGQKQSFEIYSISFTRNNKPLTIFILIIELSIILLTFTILLIVNKISTNKSTVTINYRPVENIERKDSKTVFIEYINNHFQNSDLSIETVSKETGVSPRKITHYIQNHFTCNFKTYINRLRINESKRFLIETELNIGEIAFKVGFNSQSHFNRVFKAEMMVSPTEFRDKTKNSN